MSATTKTGRTRNRREVQLQDQTQGFSPQLLGIAPARGGGNSFSFTLWDQNGAPTDGLQYSTGSTLRIITLTGLGNIAETAPAAVSLGNVVTVTPATPIASGDLVLILPWNQDIRGLNGEWIAGVIFELL
jgi:hypothetical protein